MTAFAQVVLDAGPDQELADGFVSGAARARLQLFLQGALGVLLVDRCCRRPYLQLEPNFATLLGLCGEMCPGEYRPADEQARREASAKMLVSMVQRDSDARLGLVQSGSLRSIMGLLTPTGTCVRVGRCASGGAYLYFNWNATSIGHAFEFGSRCVSKLEHSMC